MCSRVLLVDDDPAVAEALKGALAGEPDFECHYCSDPQQAIEQALRLRPSVILQDLFMPGIDGLQLVSQFRSRTETREVPIIALSTNEESELKAHVFAIGANDFLLKFPDRIELVARIRYHAPSGSTMSCGTYQASSVWAL